MSTRKETAAELHAKGYNCAQAVGCAFADQVDMSEEDIFRVLEGFGFGMGSMIGTCGAISGAIAVASLKKSVGTSNTNNKKETYKFVKDITTKFLEKNKATACRDLKGVDTGVVLRKCPDCISDAVEILEELLGE